MTSPNFKTPEIPLWIKNLSAPQYTNIFELHLGNKNLFGTETLLGDWDGHLLVVAKDFAPADEVISVAGRVADKSLAYRHNDGDGRYQTGLKTNSNLVDFLYGQEGRSMLAGAHNVDCGALYISASFLLKAGNGTSSTLTGWSPGQPPFEQSSRVLTFVLGHMPHVRAIACICREAEKLVRANPTARNIPFQYLRHPSRALRDDNAAWDRFLATSGINRVGTTLVAGHANPPSSQPSPAHARKASTMSPSVQTSNVLDLIRKHGPISVFSLTRLTGVSDKGVRNAIDKLRSSGEPIWHSVRGFWYDPSTAPLPSGSGRWKREPR